MNTVTPAHNRYVGKVCTKHPELGGLRIKGARACVNCWFALQKKYRKANPDKTSQSGKNNPAMKRSKDARRRAAKLQRTVAWADLEAIKAIYSEAARTGMTVDHIIPLQGEFVSGLHVEYNLQLLTSSENSGKCNKFIPYTEAERGVNAY